MRTLKQSFRVFWSVNGSSVWVVSLVSGSSVGPMSSGSGLVWKFVGRRRVGFHLSSIKWRRVAALLMHLLGCLHLPAVVRLIAEHFVHLLFVFFVVSGDVF